MKRRRAGKSGAERSAGGSANRKAIEGGRRSSLSLLSRGEATASRRSLRLFSLQQKETETPRCDAPRRLQNRQKKEPERTSCISFFSYLGLDGRLGSLFGVHGQLASVLLLDGPEPPPVVALGPARGREAREDFLGLAHDSEKGAEGGDAKKKKNFADRKKRKRAREVTEAKSENFSWRQQIFHSFFSLHQKRVRFDAKLSFSLESERPTSSRPSSERSAVISSSRSRGARTASGQERLGKEQSSCFLSHRRFLERRCWRSAIGSSLRAPCSRSFRAVPRARSRTGSHRSFRAP